MKLRQTIVQRILDNTSPLSLDLAKELKCTQPWVKALAEKNENNNKLTTVACVSIIKKDMGCMDDSEVLEKEGDSVAA